MITLTTQLADIGHIPRYDAPTGWADDQFDNFALVAAPFELFDPKHRFLADDGHSGAQHPTNSQTDSKIMSVAEIVRFQNTGKLSRVVTHRGTAYLSGLTAADKTGDTKDQTEQILKAADELLASVGSDKSQLLYVQIWLKDINDFDEMNSAWLDWVDADALPARATVGSSFALPEILVEIQMTAAV